ncbi:MAG: aminotransferase V [Gemmatales bacterium]|nr:MAG: aminotransferase V [Gemmatales bacterium]
MFQIGRYVFKCAESAQEFEQIHQLNYRTFVDEIPQHHDPGEPRLVDKFHKKNRYFIVLDGDRLIGMISVHDQPPFSVEDRLKDRGILRQPGMRPLEVRLLAIEPENRNNTRVFIGLLWLVYDYALSEGYTHLFISGIKERLPLYQRMGFEVLGPPVPNGRASFIPMMLTVGALPAHMMRVKRRWESQMQPSPKRSETVCLLPGPVKTSPAVRRAFHEPPLYHRGNEFIDQFQKVRHRLCRMTRAKGVALINGSGTLANEAVAATLASDRNSREGILLINGEFGERLLEQARRFGLKPRILSWGWGQPWNLDEIANVLRTSSQPCSWIWGVHQESSTGVLNDVRGLVRLAKEYKARVCLDCVSSLGAVPLNLEDIYLATGATGKSLGAYAGIAIVFADPNALQHVDFHRVPTYLDIQKALLSPGPRFTFPSPTLRALDAALEQYADDDKATACYERYRRLGVYVRQRLRDLRLEPLASEEFACPVVTTFMPPHDLTSEQFVATCQTWGFEIGGLSSYLAERRLVQIATMGDVRQEEVGAFFDRLERWLRKLSRRNNLELCRP